MDAHIQSDVASAAWSSWHEISWSDAHNVVGRLQARIAKATRAGKWRKVRALQSLLTRSTSTKVLAVKQVTENKGRKTPGIDGQTWSTPEEKWQAAQSLYKKGYKPAPLRRIHIPKANGGKRPLGIPTMRDRAMQALYLLALDPVAETLADPHSYGFRKERSTADAIEQVRNVLGRESSPKFVLEGDIKGCFDNISHDWLLAHVCMDKTILRKWLKSGYMERRRLFHTVAGTPQGGIISPVLANLALDGLQEQIDSLFKTVREARAAKVHLVRYADDFVITGSSRELLEKRVKPVVIKFLEERGLTLSETKTHITHVEDGFDFLGWNVRKRSSMLLIQPSNKNVRAFLGKVREVLKSQMGASQTQVIEKLSPVLRGWANYHRSQMATRTFAECDHKIWNALWRWAVRRHPNKGRRWIKDRYFQQVKGRDWRFGEKDQLLPHLGGVRKRPHIKIKAEANPYDPMFDEYFSNRLAGRMLRILEGRKRLRWLWRFQDGLCPECDQKITVESGWNIHHVLPRRLGGTDATSNLVLLHPNCHRQIHAV
ncbi:MAG: group II intron reverse transcriptase/maturase [Minisyncoccota bacterium]